MSIPKFMILFTPNAERVKNFDASRRNVSDLQPFVAVNGSISNVCENMNQKVMRACPGCDTFTVTWHRSHCCNNCAQGCSMHSRDCDQLHCRLLNSDDFMFHRKLRLPGKIGCNLSHQTLWLHCLSNPRTDWVFINEDDVTLTHAVDDESLRQVVAAAVMNRAHYVRMEPSRRACQAHQHRAGMKIQTLTHGDLYTMLPHAGMASYLIDRKGMKLLLQQSPLESPQDMLWSDVEHLKPLYFRNAMVEMNGCHDGADTTARLGSIILSRPPLT